MKYQELMKEVEGVGKLKLSEQENFYRDVLNESSNDLEVRVAATFYLGMAYYYEGNFNKAKDTFNKLGYKTKINTHTTSCINLFLDIYLYSEYRLIYC